MLASGSVLGTFCLKSLSWKLISSCWLSSLSLSSSQAKPGDVGIIKNRFFISILFWLLRDNEFIRFIFWGFLIMKFYSGFDIADTAASVIFLEFRDMLIEKRCLFCFLVNFPCQTFSVAFLSLILFCTVNITAGLCKS